MHSWNQPVLDNAQVILVTSERPHRKILCGSQSIPCSGFILATGAGIEWILMNAAVEYCRVRIERMLCAVAVVDIPVENKNTLETFYLLCIAGRDGYIIE